MHLREIGWSVFLGRPQDGGIGTFLTPAGELVTASEYRLIDDVADDVTVTVPEEVLARIWSAHEAQTPGDPALTAVMLAELNALDLPIVMP
jgi:hypothetical protein